ncbi:MAG: hypothetical protein GSR72_08015 [Desulfurococcales archaeon]|nr:hypothetical protein [Desulfurococcales archaeon]MEB3789818.1 hypothetical protein [Desulfurococcales archaeon]
MDPKILVIVAILAVGGIAAAIFIGGGGGTPTTNESTSTTTTSTPPTNTGTNTGTSSQVSIEGTWQGTYTSSYGQGTWKWVIKEISPGQYEGCLMTNGPYRTSDWLPVTVTVQGNQITLGAVGTAQITFTGTINGNSASGTWQFSGGGQDHGNWQGSKISSESTLPCMGSGDTGTTTPPETTSTETTTTFTGDLGCVPSPSDTLHDAYTDINLALAEVYGSDNISCGYVETSMAQYYVYTVVIDQFNPNNLPEDLQNLAQTLESYGWTNVTTYTQAGSLGGITADYSYNSYTINATIMFYPSQPAATAGIMLSVTTTTP